MHKTVHNPNEFIISRAKGYHAGFNFGFNIAEAVNFATRTWIPKGMAADYCKCREDSVRLDMGKFFELHECLKHQSDPD